MTSLFVVSPSDGGWRLTIACTGDVMVFKTCGMAQRRGLALAAEATAHGAMAEVHVQDLGGRLIGRWIDAQFKAEPSTQDVAQIAA